MSELFIGVDMAKPEAMIYSYGQAPSIVVSYWDGKNWVRLPIVDLFQCKIPKPFVESETVIEVSL